MVLRTGGIKRWGFARGNMTHGSKSKREHGSIGMNSTPSRVFPGLKMPGQMGNKRTKLRKLEVRDSGRGGVARGALACQQAGLRGLCGGALQDRLLA
jgi:ribosomal protein L3